MKKENQKGITLIALIITIIVMLILVAVAVTSVSKSGLFDHAKDATNKWADAQESEAGISIDDEIKKYTSNGIYAALYDDGTDVTLTFSNTSNFEEENLVKIYTNEKGEPVNINEIIPMVAYFNKNSIQSRGYSLCANYTIADLEDSSNAKFILVDTEGDDDDDDDDVLTTNLPWSKEGDYWKITCVDFKTRIIPENTSYWFAECWRLVKINNIQNLDTHNVTDMKYMFYWCDSLTNLDLSNFNTTNVTNMSCMFYWCSRLTNIYVGSGWSTSQANTDRIFSGCGTSSVTVK